MKLTVTVNLNSTKAFGLQCWNLSKRAYLQKSNQDLPVFFGVFFVKNHVPTWSHTVDLERLTQWGSSMIACSEGRLRKWSYGWLSFGIILFNDSGLLSKSHIFWHFLIVELSCTTSSLQVVWNCRYIKLMYICVCCQWKSPLGSGWHIRGASAGGQGGIAW